MDSAKELELEFANSHRIRTSELAACSRSGDWAVIQVDTLGVPALEAGDSKSVAVGERLIAFNVENGGRVIGGVDITGRSAPQVFGERIQISPGLSAQAAGGPLLDSWGRVVGILGGSTMAGSRYGRHNLSVNPTLSDHLNSATAAVPLAAISIATAPHSLADLTAAGVLTEPVSAMPEFLYGSTALDLSKKSVDQSPTDVSDFSVRDSQIWVYSMWQQKGKLSKGLVAARIYDQQNRLRVNVPPKKVSLSSSPSRLAFGFPPTAVGPGTARIDVTWDDRPVWRTFVHITE